MTASPERRRPRPSERFAADEQQLDLRAALVSLRAEPSAGANGHRQVALMHEGPVRLVLFAFDADGRMPQHAAPGWVTIHVLRGSLTVQTVETTHVLAGGTLLSLAPGVRHDVEATEETDMLLGIYPDSPRLAATSET